MNDEIFMQRCIDLAQKAFGKTYPNPMVGSVVVHQGRVIGEGYHKKAGEAHAEVNAINSVKNPELLKESTLYVSLEPCSHFGKTPPCSLRIVEEGFKKVVVGTLDSHEKVNGKGIDLIKKAGIEVGFSSLNLECRSLNKRFFTYHQKKRPFVILKWAESKDGFIDKDFKPTAIGNDVTQQFVHKMRSEEHAILVGTQTALNDNPSLTTRAIDGRNPTRILVDFDLKVPRDFKIFNEEADTIIINGIKNGVCGNLKFVKIDRENFLQNLMKALYENQIQSVLVEGGRTILNEFITHEIWDECFVIKNSDLILKNGTQAPSFESNADSIENFRNCTVEYFKNNDF